MVIICSEDKKMIGNKYTIIFDENKWKAEGVDIFDMLLLVLRPVVLTFFLHNVGRNFDSQQCQLPYLSFPYLTFEFEVESLM